MKTKNNRGKFWRLFSSIILALLVWYSVNGSTSNILTRYITDIPVSLVNEEALNERGLTLDNNQTYFVNLELRGTEQSLDNIDVGEITAQVDLGQIDSAGTQSLDVIVRGLNNTVILDETVPGTITLNIDEATDVTYQPTIITEGMPADGLKVISAVSQESVTVDGEISEVQKVDRISGTILVDGMSEDSTQFVSVHAYDEDGQRLDGVICQPSTVEVNIILGITKEVSVNPPIVDGQIKEGYKIVDVQVSPNKVLIAGKQNDINSIDSIDTETVVIPDGNLNKSFTLDSRLIIPKNTFILSNDLDERVTVNIEQIIQRNYTITNLETENLESGYEVVRINPGSIIAKVEGTASELNLIDASHLKGIIDVSGLEEGNYDKEITVTVDHGNLISLNPNHAEIEIKKSNQ